jgi:TonB family protein
MSIILSAVLAVLVAFPSLQPSLPGKSLDSEVAKKLVEAWPGLASSTGRKLVSWKAAAGPMSMGFVEFRFTDRGGMRTAVGFAAPSSLVAGSSRKVISEAAGWALIEVVEDRTIDDVIESLRQSRVQANEAAALGNLLSISSAETAYASANSDFFDMPSCLVASATCLPPGPARGVSFLDEGLASLSERSGYRYRFLSGPPAKAGAAKASLSSLTSFACTAVPSKAGETGELGLCRDDRGHVCATFDGAEPAVASGRCAYPCPAVGSSTRALQSASAPTRRAAARALGHMADRASVAPLVSSLQTEGTAEVRLEIADALRLVGGPEARAALFEALHDKDESVRVLVAKGLVKVVPAPSPAERRDILSVVRPLASHPVSGARAAALELLGELGDGSERALVAEGLKDTDARVSEAARDALRMIDQRTKTEAPWAPPADAVRVAGAVKMPKIVSRVEPEYPEEARARGASGTVLLEALIDVKGEVASTHIVRGVPGLDQAALVAVRQWVYEPTSVAGKRVPVIVMLTINFRP